MADRRADLSALPRWRFALYSLLPTVLLFASAEIGLRCSGLDTPSVRNVGFPDEGGLLQLDPELFWAFRPNVDIEAGGARIETNPLGLRGGPIEPKQPREFRILSLGESTTFGSGVSNDETYTHLLQERLAAALPATRFTAINAGVSAYSSFQSLRYLETRGLALQPDLVLVYHELNDYLPSTLRDSSDNEIGAVKTDRELYESRASFLRRAAVRSACVRFLTYRVAEWQLKRLRFRSTPNPLPEIGLPAAGLPGRLRLTRDGKEVRLSAREEIALGRRVSEDERRDNLAAFVEQCAQHDVRLVLIHPSYRNSVPHECALTRFARDTGTPMFDAFEALHPPGVRKKVLFSDHMHPTAYGHRRLAEGLAAFLLERGLVPRAAEARGAEAHASVRDAELRSIDPSTTTLRSSAR
jgi:lysophospholipase L1-like esterase